MFLKLCKHEFKATSRLLLLINVLFIGVAIMGRFISIPLVNAIRGDAAVASSSLYVALLVTYTVIYVIFSIVLPYFTCIYLGWRYYSHLYKAEGYMTLSLPVSAKAHIGSKLLVGTFWYWITSLNMLASVLILLSYSEIIGGIMREVAIWSIGMELLPVIIIAGLVTAPCSLLVIYGCISLGQLSNRNKGLISIAYYAVYTVIVLFVGMLASILTSPYINVSPANYGYDPVAETVASWGATMWLSTGISLVFGIIAYIITHNILSKKVNLS